MTSTLTDPNSPSTSSTEPAGGSLRPQFPLRLKLIIGFLFVALLPLIALSIINNANARNVLLEKANETLFAAAQQTAASLDDFFNNGLQNIRTEAVIIGSSDYYRLPTDVRSRADAQESLQPILRTFRGKDPLLIESYALLDLTGRVIAAHPASYLGDNEAENDYFVIAAESRLPYNSPVQFLDNLDGGFIHFSSPIRTPEGEVVGVLRARYRAESIQVLIARATGAVGGSSYAVLFDENQLYLAHGTVPNAVFRYIVTPPAGQLATLRAENRVPDVAESNLSVGPPDLSESLANATISPYFDASDLSIETGINRVAVARMESQPWQVAFFQPQEVFLAPIQEQTQSFIVLAVIAGVLVAAVGVVISQLLSGPITRLSETAAAIAAGRLSTRTDVATNDEIGVLAQTLNSMAGELEQTLLGLEARVAERTQALNLSVQVGRRLSTILDADRLVNEVVNQIQSAFDYYHVHIYLLNADGDRLHMRGGTGDAGKRLLAKGHNIPLGRGLVGRSAEVKTYLLVPDVTKDPSWLPNPELPDTKSEIAVPILIGEQVLGVLDVQQNVINGLKQSDADLLQNIANQVAVALENARLFASARQQAEQEALLNEISQKIQSETDMEQALQVAARELGRALGHAQTRIRLKTPGNGQPATLQQIGEGGEI